MSIKTFKIIQAIADSVLMPGVTRYNCRQKKQLTVRMFRS